MEFQAEYILLHEQFLSLINLSTCETFQRENIGYCRKNHFFNNVVKKSAGRYRWSKEI